MKKPLLLIAFLLLAALGFYFISQRNVSQGKDNTNLSSSLECDDGSHFIAEFPTMEELHVIVDGTQTAALPRIPIASGYRYANDAWDYFFKGENALVMDKTKQTIVQCHPVFDPNNAPVNFGD